MKIFVKKMKMKKVSPELLNYAILRKPLKKLKKH